MAVLGGGGILGGGGNGGSGTDTRYKGPYPTLAALQTAFPTSTTGDFAYVENENTFYVYNGGWQAESTGGALLAINNLSDLSDISTARNNLSVYSETQIDNLIIDGGIF
jgi:hypothetical protein